MVGVSTSLLILLYLLHWLWSFITDTPFLEHHVWLQKGCISVFYLQELTFIDFRADVGQKCSDQWGPMVLRPVREHTAQSWGPCTFKKRQISLESCPWLAPFPPQFPSLDQWFPLSQLPSVLCPEGLSQSLLSWNPNQGTFLMSFRSLGWFLSYSRWQLLQQNSLALELLQSGCHLKALCLPLPEAPPPQWIPLSLRVNLLRISLALQLPEAYDSRAPSSGVKTM